METTAVPFLPYGRQHITDDDIRAVIEVLRSDWLTQGPTIARFEAALAEQVEVSHAVACATGTAALHLAMMALGIGPGDTVVTTPNTFLADANCARFVGADVVFADVDTDTGNMSPEALSKVLDQDKDHRIKAVIPVHFAGQPVDITAISNLARTHGVAVVEDGCHALGGSYTDGGDNHKIGCCAHSDMTVFSFHPVKHVAMGEGGAVTTRDEEVAHRLMLLRNHGMTKESLSQSQMALAPDGSQNPWYYEMHQPAPNYRLTDIQAALGLSQLERLHWSVRTRNVLADCYRGLLDEFFPLRKVRPLTLRSGVVHAYHLFVVLIDFEHFGVSRAEVMNRLRDDRIGTQVHYIPVPLQPYYRSICGTGPGDFPNAESYYAQALSLPMYPNLTEEDCRRVVEALSRALGAKS